MTIYTPTVADAKDVLAQARNHNRDELFIELASALEPVKTTDLVQGAGAEQLASKVDQTVHEYNTKIRELICANQDGITQALSFATEAARYIKLFEMVCGWLLNTDIFGMRDHNDSVLERLTLIVLNDVSNNKLPEFCAGS